MHKIFTKLFLVGTCLLCALHSANAQDSTTVKQKKDGGKNLLKINLTAIPLNNYSLMYERKIGRKTSLAVGYRFMKEGGLPLKSNFKTLIDAEELFDRLDQFQTGNTAITPEIRFYMGKGVFRGFYLAPFARFSKYTAKLPFDFEYDDANGTKEATIPLEGDLKTITGGLQIGAQWKLSKLIYLDWWILGPQYGTSEGSIKGTMPLSDEMQDGLREQLTDLEDLPLVKVKSEVDANGAKVDFSGPWAGVRAGIALGIRF